jgi:aspartyl-tRNA(Asn)/glutamyl-tRNA(Gln) amidotransferase subunit A
MNITRRQFTAMTAAAAAVQTMSKLGFAAPAGASSVDDLAGMTLSEAAAKIRSGAVTSVQLTEACLSRIAVYSPKLDAFITVAKDQALAQARQLDAEQKAGKLRGPLHGVPLAIKDNIDTAGLRTTGASALFEDRVPKEDAPVIARLKAAGAIILGKTNLQEFAMGGGETSYWGPARNPWALDHNTGGSSSGSGAAIAAFMAYGALGTDTGGSVRMPASYCGIVGLKATYGLVPIRGIIPLTVSLDHCGPMTRTVRQTGHHQRRACQRGLSLAARATPQGSAPRSAHGVFRRSGSRSREDNLRSRRPARELERGPQGLRTAFDNVPRQLRHARRDAGLA